MDYAHLKASNTHCMYTNFGAPAEHRNLVLHLPHGSVVQPTTDEWPTGRSRPTITDSSGRRLRSDERQLETAPIFPKFGVPRTTVRREQRPFSGDPAARPATPSADPTPLPSGWQPQNWDRTWISDDTSRAWPTHVDRLMVNTVHQIIGHPISMAQPVGTAIRAASNGPDPAPHLSRAQISIRPFKG
ncbi:hypothetical protein ACLOJK_022812 [Asimina triloba]